MPALLALQLQHTDVALASLQLYVHTAAFHMYKFKRVTNCVALVTLYIASSL